MGSSNGTFLGQAYGSVSLPEYNTTLAAVAGSVGGTAYAYFLKFRTPSFTGESKSVTFSIPMYKGSGESATLRRAILTSDANSTKYMMTTASVTDSNQVSGTAGTVTFSGLGSETDYNSFTVDATGLKSNTVYYLVLWGYNSTGISVRQSGVEAWGSHAVSLSYANTYTLSISAGTGSSITVKRNGTTLSNGATITYGDVLTITFKASTGYNLATHTVNGSTFTSGGTHTVTGAVKVVSTATKKTYTLSISAGTGSTITVKKGSTTLSNGATITYGDVLTISFGSKPGYQLKTHTLNGSSFTSGGSHTVKGNVTVIASATALAVRIGSDLYFAYIGTGDGVALYAAYIGTGNGVEPYPGS